MHPGLLRILIYKVILITLFKSTISTLLFLLLTFSGVDTSVLGNAIEATNSSTAVSTSIFLPLISSGCTGCYFVDSINGSDRNSGMSSDRPWKSLAPVHAAVFQPGNIIHFNRGGNWDGGLFIEESGLPGKPVTYTSYGSGDPPVFSNSGDGSSWTSAVFIEADWIVVEGLIVRDVHDVGVYIANGSDHNIVRDVEASNVGEGISVYGQNNLITQNYIHDLHIINNTPGGVDDYGAVGVVLANSNNEVSYNQMIGCIADSHDFGVDGGAVEWYGTANNNYVHHNWASGNAGFLEVGGGTVQGAVVAYNVSINNGRFSLLNLTGIFGSAVSDFRVENNTIVEEAENESGWVIFSFEGNPAASTFLFRNNILYVENFEAVSNKATFSHNNNLYFLGVGTVLGYVLGSAEQITDPQFVNLVSLDLHLNPSSPAIDSGIEMGHGLDFDNRTVPVNHAPDLGAYEYQDTP